MKRKIPNLALAISLLAGMWLSGFGQIYNGEYRKGVKILAWGLLSVVFVSVDGPECPVLADLLHIGS